MRQLGNRRNSRESGELGSASLLWVPVSTWGEEATCYLVELHGLGIPVGASPLGLPEHGDFELCLSFVRDVETRPVQPLQKTSASKPAGSLHVPMDFVLCI